MTDEHPQAFVCSNKPGYPIGPVYAYAIAPNGEHVELSPAAKVFLSDRSDMPLLGLDPSQIHTFTFTLSTLEIDDELLALLTGTTVVTLRQAFDESLRLSAFLEWERQHWYELPVLWERKAARRD